MVLLFSERSRTFYGNTIDVMGGCTGRHLGGPRSPPGGCKKLEETRREVLQRFLPRVAPLADTSFSSQFVRKPWKLRVFLETTRKHGNGNDSYLSLEVTPYCAGNFSQMTFLSCDFPPPSRVAAVGIFSGQRLWINREKSVRNTRVCFYKIV